ncbi:YajG family lipoprotein [Coraliomargarita parva]|uniref:YajG family lipoprotein n=1 Tax=Coraliomargarita parva TaxID=3014050 RepID=UPI0022B36093|nr:YajG family lipoprotein [Coraliomargarita parva]
MKNWILRVTISLTVLFWLSGCVLGRRTVDLNVPQQGAYAGATKGTVYVGEVKDNRVFMNNPGSPSIPSIDGDVNEMSAEERLCMIGRQRNGFGKAMGDIATENNETVLDLTKDLLEEGLKRRGYAISQDPNSKLRIEATIDEFWAWFTPGAFAIKFEARVNCDVSIDGAAQSELVVVKGYGRNQGQVASDANWALAYERAFNDFLDNFASALSAKGY